MNARLNAFAAALVALSAPAAANNNNNNQCSLTISPSGAVIANYDALLGGAFTAPITLRITNNGGAACSGSIRFEVKPNSQRLRGPNNERLSYLIVQQNNPSITLFDPLTGQNAGLPVTVGPGATIELRPELFVDGGQRGQSGRYEADVDATYRNGQGQPRPVTATVAVAADVVPSVQANFVGLDGGTGSSATLRLGELSTGLKRTIGFQLRANTDVDITVSSENRGRLKRQGGSELIRYDLEISGGQVNLNQDDLVKLRLGPDSVRGSTQPMEVEVGSIAGAPAGRYRDTVIFRISGR
jgi:hypothetical protein